MAKVTIKSATVTQGESRCECCGAKIRNIVTITHLSGETQEIGSTCFKKRFGFKPRAEGYPGTIKIEFLCGGSAVKTVANKMHLNPAYRATVNLTANQIEELARLEASGVTEVSRVEWNRPYYWQTQESR